MTLAQVFQEILWIITKDFWRTDRPMTLIFYKFIGVSWHNVCVNFCEDSKLFTVSSFGEFMNRHKWSILTYGQRSRSHYSQFLFLVYGWNCTKNLMTLAQVFQEILWIISKAIGWMDWLTDGPRTLIFYVIVWVTCSIMCAKFGEDRVIFTATHFWGGGGWTA